MRAFASSLALFACSVQAFSINGHLAVANIAQNLLTDHDAAALKSALSQLVTLRNLDPELTSHEGNHPFIECATFADDIKYHGGMWQQGFHFIDYPFIDQAGKTTKDYPGSDVIPANNIVAAITDITDWLSGKNGKGYQKSYIYDYIQHRLYPGNYNAARSYALRLLIHYVGDLHQPFHTTSRFNDQYPKGDKGANAFPVPNHYDANELHAVWDKVLYTQPHNIARPVSDEDFAKFQESTVNPYMTKYKVRINAADVTNRDVEGWSKESFDHATTMYKGATESEKLPQSYLDANIPLIEGNITLGGYRLYSLISYIYTKNAATLADEPTAFLQ